MSCTVITRHQRPSFHPKIRIRRFYCLLPGESENRIVLLEVDLSKQELKECPPRDSSHAKSFSAGFYSTRARINTSSRSPRRRYAHFVESSKTATFRWRTSCPATTAITRSEEHT